MAVKFVSGDIFSNRYNAQALAHGCNCQGAMGAGIAKEFRRRYPDMYDEYRNLCKATPRQFNPGDSFLWKAEDKPWVFNLATQEDYRQHRATYGAVERSLEEMRQKADQEGINSVAMPKVRTGLGGLSWEKVRPVIERVFSDWPGTLYVYEKFAPEE